jgi:hypothetical protein
VAGAEDDSRVTYILDRDIIRFIKFTGAVLGVFGVVGLFFFGFSTEKTVENILEARDALKSDQQRTISIQNTLTAQQSTLSQAGVDMAAAQIEIATHQANLDAQESALKETTNDLVNSQAELDTHQAKLANQEASLEQTTNDLATAQAILITNQEAMSTTMKILTDTIREARSYLIIIIEQKDRALQLTEEQQLLLAELRSQKPEDFRDPDDDSKLWPIGKTITVSFLDGDPLIHDKVKEYVLEWTNYANINFDFLETANADADIRISFEQTQGSYSYIGTDSLAAQEGKPTMNIPFFGSIDYDYLREVTLRLFGQALGLLFEISNPNANIRWDEDAVYSHFESPPYNWNKDWVDRWIFSPWDYEVYPYLIDKEFDPESIMINIPIPNELTEGDLELTPQSSLSAKDKEFISVLYPKDDS